MFKKPRRYGPKYKHTDEEMLEVWHLYRIRGRSLSKAGEAIGVDKKTAQRLVIRCERDYTKEQLEKAWELIPQLSLFAEAASG